MSTIEVVFAGLIALAFPQRGQTPTEARILFVPASGHTKYLEVSSVDLDKGKTSAAFVEKGGVATFNLDSATRITFVGPSVTLSVQGSLEKKLIDVQDASGNSNLTDEGWGQVLRIELKNGAFKAGKIIKDKNGKEQKWGYQNPKGVDNNAKAQHPAASTFRLEIDSRVIVIEGVGGGTVTLKPSAKTIKFYDDSPQVGNPGMRISHYVAVYEKLLGITDPDRQFLPIERGPVPGPLKPSSKLHPERCPPLIAYKIAQ